MHASAWRSEIGRQLTGHPRLPRVRMTSRTPSAINNAVEVAPDAHGGQRRPSCVRVLPNTRAVRRTLRAAPRTDLRIIVTTLSLLRPGYSQHQS
ncbi:hypothetical protein EVAR_20397_1 [Eumeta japonica]|uniref:Uncharacterized protein n=1 Tax=Eumeta variegata TaxID=151549 RepID=A0A4C1TXX0_EUMVA|nr:hypothetical protein EVAR_20397_1 [Eumeta japonica]